MKPELVFGLKDGKIAHISEVESGLICGCICPKCARRLIAKKGSINIWHFAHEDDSDCKLAIETALHLAAKEILEKEGRIRLPSLKFDNWTAFNEQILEFDEVKIEQHYQDIIPDVLIYKKGRPLIIEIKMTHAVDEAKLQKIKEIGTSAIEVDLLNTNSPDSNYSGFVRDYVIDSVLNKKWLYNAKESKYRAQIERRKKQCRVRAWWYDADVCVSHCSITGAKAICSDCEYLIEYVESMSSVYGLKNRNDPDYVYCRKLLKRG